MDNPSGADIGSVKRCAATELNLRVGSNGKIVSRGNLFSHVQITGNFTGLIASNGDIGQQAE